MLPTIENHRHCASHSACHPTRYPAQDHKDPSGDLWGTARCWLCGQREAWVRLAELLSMVTTGVVLKSGPNGSLKVACICGRTSEVDVVHARGADVSIA